MTAESFMQKVSSMERQGCVARKCYANAAQQGIRLLSKVSRNRVFGHCRDPIFSITSQGFLFPPPPPKYFHASPASYMQIVSMIVMRHTAVGVA